MFLFSALVRVFSRGKPVEEGAVGVLTRSNTAVLSLRKVARAFSRSSQVGAETVDVSESSDAMVLALRELADSLESTKGVTAKCTHLRLEDVNVAGRNIHVLWVRQTVSSSWVVADRACSLIERYKYYKHVLDTYGEEAFWSAYKGKDLLTIIKDSEGLSEEE